MSEDTEALLDPQNIVRMPPDDEIRRKFEEYCLAVGKVAYAWNYMHERLFEIYIITSELGRVPASVKWYKIFSDTKQRKLLCKSVNKFQHWTGKENQSDIQHLLDHIGGLANERNNAIHAPVSLLVQPPAAGGAVMGAGPFSLNPRAKDLLGKPLLEEFARLEIQIEKCSRYVALARNSLHQPSQPWPNRNQLA